MPWRNLDAVFYCERPAEFEYREGMFFAVQQVGSLCIQRVYSPHVFLRMLRNANAAAKLFKAEPENIVPFSLSAGS